MGFTDEAIRESMDLWEQSANERFLNEMADGTMSKEKFFDYIIQDSLYLRDYLKMYAYAMAKSGTWEEMKVFYAVLGYINDGENTTRLGYLKECGMTDADVDLVPKRRQCREYTEFLIKTGKGGDPLDIIIASMPCMMGYHYVFSELIRRAPHLKDSYYAPLIADYTNQGYADYVEYWKGYVDGLCEGLSDDRRLELKALFRQASYHELWFWQMAGEDRE